MTVDREDHNDHNDHNDHEEIHNMADAMVSMSTLVRLIMYANVPDDDDWETYIHRAKQYVDETHHRLEIHDGFLMRRIHIQPMAQANDDEPSEPSAYLIGDVVVTFQGDDNWERQLAWYANHEESPLPFRFSLVDTEIDGEDEEDGEDGEGAREGEEERRNH